MKFATSVLMMAATAGLALLALTTRKQAEIIETAEATDNTATSTAPAEVVSDVPADVDAWFV